MSGIHASQGATALLGLPGLVVGAQELIDGEWWLHVQTTTDVAGCPECGTRAVGHGRTYSAVRDLPVAGRPVVLVFARRRWRCCEPDCGRNTWSEQVGEIPARSSLTRRARTRIAAMVNDDGDTVADAAGRFGVCWHTADAAVAAAADKMIAEPGRLEGVTAVGVDEKRFLNANAAHRTVFTTQIVDLEHHQLLDVLQGRSRDVLGDWMAARGPRWCQAVTLATLDPAAGYRAALDEHLPNATIVVDHFHVVRLANKAIDDIRRRTQWATHRPPRPQARPAVSGPAGIAHRLRTPHRRTQNMAVRTARGR